jgi:hypothetical protein
LFLFFRIARIEEWRPANTNWISCLQVIIQRLQSIMTSLVYTEVSLAY